MKDEKFLERELSEKTIEDFLPNGSSKKKAQQAIGEMRQAFAVIALETQDLMIKKKKVELELAKVPVMQGLKDLKKKIRSNKKRMEQLAAILQGGMQLAEKLGIKVDSSVMKMIGL